MSNAEQGRARSAVKRAACTVAAAVLFLAGCTTPGNGTPAPSYFLLEVPATLAPLPGASAFDLALGPVRIAEYLDQPHVVSRASGGAVTRYDRARWAMPLGANLSDVLRGALERLLPGTRTVAYPAAQPAPVSYRIALEVLQLDGSPAGDGAGTATLVASWRILDADGATVAWPEARTTLSAPLRGSDAAALVAAETVLAGELATRIAQALLALPPTP